MKKKTNVNKKKRKYKIITIIFLVAQIAGLITSIPALMSTRTSQGTIAWIVSLNTFPIIAVPAYWIFGQSKFKGYVTAKQLEELEVHDSVESIYNKIKDFIPNNYDEYGRIKALERLAEMPFTNGNEVELLIDGKETFQSILNGIEEAEDYILFQTFIIKDDNLGNELRNKLIEKAKQGVRVYFLYDGVGSHKLADSFVKKMKDASIHVSAFNSGRKKRRMYQINFRNHRKIVVVDGKDGWIGGHNVADEYIGEGKKFDSWRDTHLKITGPAVLGLQLTFLEDWHWCTEEIINMSWNPVSAADRGQIVLIIPSGPSDQYETASLMMQQAIHSAKKRIWIASPYFVPDNGVKDALQLAALRGVDVRILIPDNPDHILVYLSAYAFLEEMIKSGVKIYRYLPGFMHQKVFLVDDNAAAVGTVNLDNRSFRLNFEITAVCMSTELAAEVKDMLLVDFSNSREMTQKELQEKPYWFKIVSRIAYLFTPIL